MECFCFYFMISLTWIKNNPTTKLNHLLQYILLLPPKSSNLDSSVHNKFSYSYNFQFLWIFVYYSILYIHFLLQGFLDGYVPSWARLILVDFSQLKSMLSCVERKFSCQLLTSLSSMYFAFNNQVFRNSCLLVIEFFFSPYLRQFLISIGTNISH